MIFAKVLIPAIVVGLMVLVVSSLPFDFIEKTIGVASRGDPFVREAVAALGALLGAIAGATKAIVDAIEKKGNSN